MEPKPFWMSKTVWVNAIAVAFLASQHYAGGDWLQAEDQVLILALVNLALRALTRRPVDWS